MAEPGVDQLEAQVALLEAQLLRAREQLETKKKTEDAQARQGQLQQQQQHEAVATPATPTQEQAGRKRKRSGASCRKYCVCKHEGCDNYAIRGGVCIQHGAKRKVCSAEGCTKSVVQGGVCASHGATYKKYYCKIEGCNFQVMKKGLCGQHGHFELTRCSAEGCQRQARQGGVCESHGAPKKKCRVEGCETRSRKDGLCDFHGRGRICCYEGCNELARKSSIRCVQHPFTREDLPNCSVDGCTNRADSLKSGLCRKHGIECGAFAKKQATKPNKHRCSAEGCAKWAIFNGVCRSHGSEPRRYFCKVAGCEYQVVKKGLCRNHGNFQLKTCSFEGCTSSVAAKGLCRKHGPPHKRARKHGPKRITTVRQEKCSVEGCTDLSFKGGRCYNHEIRKSCISDTNATGGVCNKHSVGSTAATAAVPPPRPPTECGHELCSNIYPPRGLCAEHGAKKKLCITEGCTNQSVSGAMCNEHVIVQERSHEMCSSISLANVVGTGNEAKKKPPRPRTQ